MLTHSFVALVLSQAVLGPVCPPGSNQAFGELVLAIERHAEKGEFDAAKKLLPHLPEKTITVRWDESAVPEKMRSEFRAARNKAFEYLSGSYKVEVVEAKTADVAFSFAKELPPNADSPGPAGAVHFFSLSPDEPRLETVISLSRGGVPQSTEYNDVHNEVGYALMAFLGVARSPLAGGYSSRTEESNLGTHRPSIQELAVARDAVKVSEVLKSHIAEGKRLIPTEPKMGIQPTEVHLEPVLQGEPVRFSLLVNNTGNAPLLARVRPDCSCMSASSPPAIEPGRSGMIEAAIDTHDVAGLFDQGLIIYTNDFEMPVRRVPVKIKVKPRYRFIMQEPQNAVVLEPSKGKKVPIYLSLPADAEIKPETAQLDGMKANVTFEPWSGTLADPEIGESAKPRKGYVFHVDLAPTTFPGRAFATLVVETDNDKFPVIRKGFSIQKGIVALPDSLFLGNIGKEARRASFILSRPEKPFKITKLETSSKSLSVTTRPLRGAWEHKVTVQYDGSADFGNYNEMLTVHTDDPSQPHIKIPVRAMIR